MQTPVQLQARVDEVDHDGRAQAQAQAQACELPCPRINAAFPSSRDAHPQIRGSTLQRPDPHLDESCRTLTSASSPLPCSRCQSRLHSPLAPYPPPPQGELEHLLLQGVDSTFQELGSPTRSFPPTTSHFAPFLLPIIETLAPLASASFWRRLVVPFGASNTERAHECYPDGRQALESSSNSIDYSESSGQPDHLCDTQKSEAASSEVNARLSRECTANRQKNTAASFEDILTRDKGVTSRAHSLHSATLRQRTLGFAKSDGSLLPAMARSQDTEEAVSFLPRTGNDGSLSSRKSSRWLSLFSRRRRVILILCMTTLVGSQLYLFGPRIFGEDGMKRLGQKIDDMQSKFGGDVPPPVRPDYSSGNDRPPPSAAVGTSLAGNKVYLPTLNLPPGYDDPLTSTEDSLSLDPSAFPPELVRDPPGTQAWHKETKDADPHRGQIPDVQLQRLERSPSGQRPVMPKPVLAIPQDYYSPRSGWSSATHGSKTSYLDALDLDQHPPREDWRPPPYDSWRPPSLLPKGSVKLPLVQHTFSAPDRHSGEKGQSERDQVNAKRQDLVRKAFLYAWEAYKANAWGHDEIKPATGTASDAFNGWGATIVDALDTLLVMEMPDEYDFARQHVRDIDFHLLAGTASVYGTSDGRVPVFETAIRYLGGFLSAYDLSGDEVMRDRAEELAQLILPAFNTLTGVPLGRLRLTDKGGQRYSAGSVILAEAASMLLEMTRLWQVTGNRTYFDTVQRTTDWLDRNMTGTPDRLGALLPTSIFPERGTMYGWYSWGGMVDSAYEYLIKEHQLLGGRLAQYGRMFEEAVDSARQWLIRGIHTVPNAPLLIFGHSNGKSFQPKLEHLTCFAGGTIGLGARLLPNRQRDLSHAQRVTEACWWAYNATATGIGPEEITFYRDRDTDRFDTVYGPGGTSRRGKARGAPIVGVRSFSPDYRNRPETIESVFYMWRITGDQKWQERGWQMFSSWVTHSMSHYGFSSIRDVTRVPVTQTDSMESFVFAETFKYYYLLFSPPGLISLDDYVFTTEAHPLLTPKNGVWARPASGPRKFWDPKASHTPANPTDYAGGELGPIGGMTSVQKKFMRGLYDKEQDAIEAERKAKEKSLLNTVKVNSANLRKKIKGKTPSDMRPSVENKDKTDAGKEEGALFAAGQAAERNIAEEET